jgi:DUF4097 and DUF4098 domain-containing protein YvlB
MNLRPYLIVLAALGAAAAPAVAQDRRDRDPSTITSRIDTTVTLARGGTVDLSLISGEIIVTAGSGDRVQVRAHSERGTLSFSASPNRVSLEVRSNRGRLGETRYEVTVPVGARLELRAVSGDITSRGTRGEVEAATVSGDLEVTDATRIAYLETVSGDLTASNLSGDVRASSVSGDVELENVDGELEVETVSGELRLSGIRTKSIRTETVSGDLTYDGTLDSGGRYDFHSHSGTIELRVPSNSGGNIRVETYSGSIDSDFPMNIKPGERIENRPKRMEFSFGNGGARITAETFSGDIMIQRAGSSAVRDR